MFILTTVLLSWSAFAVAVAAVGLLVHGLSWAGSEGVQLESANLVVVKPDGNLAAAVDITPEVAKLLLQGCTQLPLLPRLLALPIADNVHDALAECLAQQHAGRAQPLCYLDFRYATTPRPWLGGVVEGGSEPRHYRCVCPVHAFSQTVRLPSACPRGRSALTSAVLTLRCDGDTRRQLSCNVTDKIRALRSPSGDVHRLSPAKWHPLDRHVLGMALHADMDDMVRSLAMAARPTRASHGDLKSIGAAASDNELSFSVRIHFPKQRAEVIKL